MTLAAGQGWAVVTGWREQPAHPAQQLAWGALLALAYFAGARLGFAYAVVGNAVSLVWPPSGIALVALLAFGPRLAIGVAGGSLLANLSIGVPPAVALGIAAGASLEAVGALMLLRRVRFDPALGRRRDVLALILLAAVVSTTFSALTGVAAMRAGGLVAPAEHLAVAFKWWLGDMMGVLVVAPPLLVALTHCRPPISPRKAAEALGLAAVVGASGYLIFGAHELAGHGYFPAALAIFPFVIWAALRFNHWGASLATLAVSVLAIWGTSHATGPFAAASAVDSLLRWCAFVNVLAASGLLLAAAQAEAQRAQAELKDSHTELERRVCERTDDLARANAELRAEMAERHRLEERLIQVGDDQRQAIGRELHDGLGQQLTSIGLHGAALQHKLKAAGHPAAEDAGRIVVLAQQAAGTTRAVVRGLYPVTLDAVGLPGALQELAHNTQTLSGIECIVLKGRDVRVGSPEVAIHLYRIAQEALNNAVKHSQARRIWIELNRADGAQCLAISDDGVGIAAALVEGGAGLGMHNLRHRARQLGGACRVSRNGRGGTTVAVTYPLVEELA